MNATETSLMGSVRCPRSLVMVVLSGLMCSVCGASCEVVSEVPSLRSGYSFTVDKGRAVTGVKDETVRVDVMRTYAKESVPGYWADRRSRPHVFRFVGRFVRRSQRWISPSPLP